MDDFVTGGTGFIGRWLVLELTQKGRSVGVLARNKMTTGVELLNWIDRHGGDSKRIYLIEGDMRKPELGMSTQDQEKLKGIFDVYNLASMTGWGLRYDDAYQVNVEAPLELIKMIAERAKKVRRFIHITGYKAGKGRHTPDSLGFEKQRDWGKYRWAWYMFNKGIYHGTKIKAHYAVQRACQDYKIPLTIINPAALIGDSKNGEISLSQSDGLLSLIDQLYTGKLMAIPGRKDDWLPLVPVDYLAAFIANISAQKESLGQAYFVIDERTPPLRNVIQEIAHSLELKPPRFHLPIWLMKLCLRAGLSKFLGISHEGLGYITGIRYNVDDEKALAEHFGITRDDIMVVLRKTVKYYTDNLLKSKRTLCTE